MTRAVLDYIDDLERHGSIEHEVAFEIKRRIAAQTDAPGQSVEIGTITIATNDTGACFFPATADSSVSVPQEPNNEEMENYRMALAYISKQSTDQQSRELAETALNAFPADRVPQSPDLKGGE